MKAYIEDLVGDEDQVVIDVAIIQCDLQEAIYGRISKYAGTTDFNGLWSSATEAVVDFLEKDARISRQPILNINWKR